MKRDGVVGELSVVGIRDSDGTQGARGEDPASLSPYRGEYANLRT